LILTFNALNGGYIVLCNVLAYDKAIFSSEKKGSQADFLPEM